MLGKQSVRYVILFTICYLHGFIPFNFKTEFSKNMYNTASIVYNMHAAAKDSLFYFFKKS